MAAKKKPAITGLHSQGIIDDIISAGSRKIAKIISNKKVKNTLINKATRHEMSTMTGVPARKFKEPFEKGSTASLRRYEKLTDKQAVIVAKRAKTTGVGKKAEKLYNKKKNIQSQRNNIKGWGINNIDDYVKAERYPHPSVKRGQAIIAARKAGRKAAVKKIVRRVK